MKVQCLIDLLKEKKLCENPGMHFYVNFIKAVETKYDFVTDKIIETCQNDNEYHCSKYRNIVFLINKKGLEQWLEKFCSKKQTEFGKTVFVSDIKIINDKICSTVMNIINKDIKKYNMHIYSNKIIIYNKEKIDEEHCKKLKKEKEARKFIESLP